ncbi:PREDICTED: uncharacterized protein LOC108661599 [Theobroma cacao]|uniref:Uncharacterized protein LOC108661599 n=1 Tax=Theobroma cacao TaxID=3641 RepID=A0AB32W3M5_THECC|nr:PREDICTED: uncharacterized protein LOC108661599 [Theobroma cacao]
MSGDRSWMYCRLQNGFITTEFVNGVTEFINFACSKTTFMWKNKIRCPCTRCSNNKFLDKDKVTEHILNRGFTGAYTIWSLHRKHDVGQSSRSKSRVEPSLRFEGDAVFRELTYEDEIENSYTRMVRDAMCPEVAFNHGSENELSFMEEDPNPNASSFYSLLSNAEEPLWVGCTKHTTLSVVSQLLNVKAEYNLSESCFDQLLEIIKNMLPSDENLPIDFYRMKKKGCYASRKEPLWVGCTKHTTLSVVSQLLNVKAEYNLSESCFDRLLEKIKNMLPSDENLPIDFYKMKKKVAKLGLGYIKIDACKNNCMLFYERFATFQHCQVCGHPRYKQRNLSVRRQKKIPYKILRYLPLIPRLQRLYMSCKTAEHMTWHAQHHSDD